jgi:hypothetical protein
VLAVPEAAVPDGRRAPEPVTDDAPSDAGEPWAGTALGGTVRKVIVPSSVGAPGLGMPEASPDASGVPPAVGRRKTNEPGEAAMP